MPSFKSKINNDQCIINVWIFPALEDKNKERKINLNNIKNNSFKALIDTGAQSTCVSQNIINQLSLEPKGKISLQSASETLIVNQYSVDIMIPIDKRQLLKNNQIQVDLSIKQSMSHRVSELKSSGDKFDILLGMDIISGWNLILAHGDFIFSY